MMNSILAQHTENESFAQTPVQSLDSDRYSKLKNVASELLSLIELNNRQGLLDTPDRFARAIEFLTSGYKVDTHELVGDAIFDDPSSELVFLRDIEFFSLCEHHLLPFFGVAHVAYVPSGKIIGLSKIPRLVNALARQLQVQERLTFQIAEEIEKLLKPKGVIVVLEASHLCVMMRGVEKQQSRTLTKSTLGTFSSDHFLRSEFFSLLGR